MDMPAFVRRKSQSRSSESSSSDRPRYSSGSSTAGVYRVTAYISFPSDTTAVWELYPKLMGHLAFDIGANGGAMSSILAENFDKVVAVEPAEESYRHLREVALPNVCCVNRAVTSQGGWVELRETTRTKRTGELYTGDSLAGWGATVGQRNVRACTLDHLTRTYGQPDFVKIDTEGHEVEVLKGGAKTLAGRPRFIIEIHSKDLGEQCKLILYAAGLDWTEHLHEGYREGSPTREKHYWLVGGI